MMMLGERRENNQAQELDTASEQPEPAVDEDEFPF